MRFARNDCRGKENRREQERGTQMQDKDQKRICAPHLSALPSGTSAAKPRQFDAITPVYDDVRLETGNSRGRLEQTEQHFDSSTADSGSRGRLLLVVLPGLKTARAITADPSWQLSEAADAR